jgi:hypothetical protein
MEKGKKVVKFLTKVEIQKFHDQQRDKINFKEKTEKWLIGDLKLQPDGQLQPDNENSDSEDSGSKVSWDSDNPLKVKHKEAVDKDDLCDAVGRGKRSRAKPKRFRPNSESKVGEGEGQGEGEGEGNKKSKEIKG